MAFPLGHCCWSTLSTSMAPGPRPDAKFYLTPVSSSLFCSCTDPVSVTSFSTPCKEQYLLWVQRHSCSLAGSILINTLKKIPRLETDTKYRKEHRRQREAFRTRLGIKEFLISLLELGACIVRVPLLVLSPFSQKQEFLFLKTTPFL